MTKTTSQRTCFNSKTLKKASSACSAALDCALPSRCQLCAGRASGLLCNPCLREALSVQHSAACAVCALPLATKAESKMETRCSECIKQTPSYTKAICGSLFDEPIDQLLHQFKDHYGFQWTKLLCRPLLNQIRSYYQGEQNTLPAALVPMPLHWRKHWRRGYNQSDIIATYLSQRLSIHLHRGLKKIKSTAPQHDLNRKDRLRNLMGSFNCREDLRGLHLALVDDVLTTGTSAECAAQTLLDAGAGRVDIWTLARTPKPEWR